MFQGNSLLSPYRVLDMTTNGVCYADKFSVISAPT